MTGQAGRRRTKNGRTRAKADGDGCYDGTLTCAVRANYDVEARARAEGHLVVGEEVRQGDANDGSQLEIGARPT
jgi:hypothetical protein